MTDAPPATAASVASAASSTPQYELDEDGIPTDVRVYKEKGYWDFRFGGEDCYDWLGDIDAMGLKDELVAAIGPTGRCLILGCGTSTLTERLRDAGVRSDQLVSVDYSAVVIDKMAAKYGDSCGQWLVCGECAFNRLCSVLTVLPYILNTRVLWLLRVPWRGRGWACTPPHCCWMVLSAVLACPQVA